MKCIATQSPPDLNAVFAALSDPTRREILSRLTGGPLSVGAIAEPFQMSQPAISKHLKVLEQAGLINRATKAQSRPAELNATNMKAAVDWLEHFRTFWTDSFDQLDVLLEDMKQDQSKDLTP